MKPLRSVLHPLVRDRETSWTFTALATALYVGFLIWAHIHHEAWRDEIHPWVVAKRAQGFWDIATGDRIYDGHPPLWYWYLHIWTWFTHRAWGLHAANVVVMAGVALLWLRYAPFARALKLGLLCSYQVTFEYGVVSRNYGLGLLLVVMFCARFHPLRPRLLTQSALLGLLCLTSIYGTIIAACLFVTLIPTGARADVASSAPGTLDFQISPGLLAGTGVLLAAVGLCLYTTTPPDPNPASPGWDFAALDRHVFSTTARRLVITFLPVRHFDSARYWGNVWAFWGEHDVLLSAVGVVLLVVLPTSLLPPWSHAVMFVVGASLMAVFQAARYVGGPRHWGHFIVLYVALAWISRQLFPRRDYILSSVLLVVTVFFQVESLIAAIERDRLDLFSGGPEAASFIEGHGLQDLPLVAGPEDAVISLTGHLGRVFISSESEEVNETMVFHGRRRPFDEHALVARAIEVGKARRSPVLLVSNRTLPPPDDPVVKIELLFKNSQDGPHDENFVVYRLSSQDWTVR